MELVKDLGMLPVGNKGHRQRFGIYECPRCYKHFKCAIGHVRSGHTTKCRSCADEATARAKACKASDSFEEKANIVHNYTYEYTAVNYSTSRTKVKIICKIHGIFEQTPNNHLSGNGCPECAKDKVIRAAKEFEEKAKALHGDVYDYTEVSYNNSSTKVKIICPIHGAFSQNPDNHLQGHGCPSCAEYGFNKNKPAIVYYIKVNYNGIVAYKIGITNRTVKARFTNDDLSKITVIKTWEYLLGAEAYNHEQKCIKLYKDYKYQGEAILSSGNTELFTKDILGLDQINY